MADEWREVRLEECMDAIIDYRGKTPRKTSAGVPLITAKIVKGGRIETPEEFIDAAEFDAWMRRGMPEPGDVLITTEAPLGEVAQLGNERSALAQRLIALRGKRGVLDNTFLKYLLMSPEVQDRIHARGSGTTVIGIRQAELREVFLPFPSFDEQRAIARVLGVLDDKIELNRRMNRTLEDLARAMFKSWFVDFDPVIAKAAGKKPVGMSAQTAALFPDRFQDSPLGPIPKGWRLGSIDSLCSLHRDQLDPAESPGEPFAHFSIPAFDNGREAVTEMGSAIKSGKLVIPDGSVMLSKLNPHVPRVWLPDDSIRRRRIASTEFLVCLPRCGITRSYLYEQFAAAPFLADLATMVTGTSNSHQRVKPDDFARMPVVIPPDRMVTAFDSRARRMLDRTQASRRAISLLTELRDALLPQLMSGDLRVHEAASLIAEAG